MTRHLTRDGWFCDDGHDPEAADGWRWCAVHGAPYYGRECAACGVEGFSALIDNEADRAGRAA